MTTRGVIYVHAAPAALTPHLEWAVAGVLDPQEPAGHEDWAFEAVRPASSAVPLPPPATPVEKGYGSAFAWTPQPAEPGTVRAEVVWEGPAGTAGRIASALRGWPRLRFEVTEDASSGSEGERYAWTPARGMFRATVGVHGDILVGEDRLRAAMADAAGSPELELSEVLEALMGQPWDEELEPFRYAGEGAPVRILHHVI